jgi:hypothetical protein
MTRIPPGLPTDVMSSLPPIAMVGPSVMNTDRSNQTRLTRRVGHDEAPPLGGR